MKKRIVLIVSIILVFAVAVGVGVFMLSDTSREPMAKILVSNYNRHDAVTTDGGSLVQIGARLYYSVSPKDNPVKYGIYEITNRGIERIWWDGIKSSSESENYHPNLASYEDHLAEIDPETGQISLFDFDKSEFVPQEGLYSEYVLERNEYRQYQTESDSPVLFMSLFGGDYYIADRNSSPVLYRINPDGEDDKMLFDFSQIEGGAVCREMYTREATLYVEFISDSGLCCVEYYPEKDKTVVVGSDDYVGRFISSTDRLRVNNPADYAAGDPEVGIFITSVQTKETVKVYDGYVVDYHILDNEWIYFTLEDYSLWRVSYDGEALEQVF